MMLGKHDFFPARDKSVGVWSGEKPALNTYSTLDIVSVEVVFCDDKSG